MDAFYESGLILVRDKTKMKGYQATYNAFVESTLKSNKHSRTSGSINVSLDQPAIGQI